MATRGGLSVLDWRSHAVDEFADHPLGVYRVWCGHLLMMVTELTDGPGQQALRGVRRDAGAGRAGW